MPATCENCRHWHRSDPSQLKLAGGIAPEHGECHHSPPAESFKWPRTFPQNTCGQWAEGELGTLNAKLGTTAAEMQAELLAVEHARAKPARGKAKA